MGMRVHVGDRLRALLGDLLDVDAALRGAHIEDPPRAAIQHRREVVLVHDIGGRRDQHLTHRDALDVHAQDARRDLLGSGRVGGQLHAAGLATAADQHLRLDDDLLGTGREESLGRGARVGRRPGHRPRRHGQALGDEERLGVCFLDLHGAPMVQEGQPARRTFLARRDGTRRSVPSRPVPTPAVRCRS